MSTLNVNRIVDASGGVFAPVSSVFRSRIINGGMVIDQRNAGASITPTNGQYSVDRWKCFLTQASKYTIQQNAGSVTPPVGFVNYLGITSSSAYSVGASDYFFLQQNIEGFNFADFNFGSANAKTVTLSFWVRSSLTGTFGGSLSNNAGNRSYPFSYTINAANTWEYETITIAGDTTGTWTTDNSIGCQVNLGFGVGSTFSATAGSWTATSTILSSTGATSVVGTNGATFYITGVQLEVGTQATSFEYRQYTTELQLCQRYYEYLTVGANESFVGQCTSTTQVRTGWNFSITKRDSPTMSTSGTVNVVNAGAGTGYAVTITYFSPNINNTSVFCNIVSGTPLVAGNASNLYSSGGSAKIIASAEL
jgi:hypothetical protein